MTMTMAAGRAANPERRFFWWMTVATIACIVLGFARSFFLRPLFPGVHAPTEMFFYIHGTVFALWLTLLLTQASLVSAGNVALHRTLGIAGFVMVPLMVVLGAVGGAVAAHRPGGFIDIPVPPLEFLVVPYANIALFAAFTGTGLALRGNPPAHKRLMLLGTITIAEAGIARWPFEPYISLPPLALWTTAALVVPIAVWDFYAMRRIHPVTLIGAVALCAEGPVRDMISHTSWWLEFAKWATSFVG